MSETKRNLRRNRALGGLLLAASAWTCLVPAPLRAQENGGAPTPLEAPLFAVSGPSPVTHFKDPMGITVSPRGDEFLVADTGHHEVLIYSADGTLSYRFTHFADTEKELVPGSPRCALEGSNGRIYITDAESRFITVVDSRGETLRRIDPLALLAKAGSRMRPGYMAWAPGGILCVTLAGDGAGIMQVDADDRLIRFFDGPSPEEGQLSSPTGISVDKDGRILVTDPGAEFAVNIFSPDGHFVSGFGRHDTGWQNFSFASGVVEAGGVIWVADAVRQVVKGLSPTGAALYMLGGLGAGPGDFMYPISVAADGRGRLLVLEKVGARVQAFDLPAERVAAKL